MSIFKNILNLITKADDKEGLSYRGTSLSFGDTLNASTSTYYKLYRQNTDLRRCIEELYQTIGKDGYKLYQNGNEIKSQRIDDALKFDGFDRLKSIIVRDLIISGNAFITDVLNPSNQIIGFQPLDPRTMKIFADKYGNIGGYAQCVQANVVKFTPEELFHTVDAVDPDNEIWGISKIETLVLDILADKESSSSNYAFFKNNAIPSTIITLDNELDENEINIAVEQLKKQFTGGSNQHKVSASNGIKDVKVIGSTMKDMEFTLLRGFTTERICAATGVPKTILGYSDNVNFSTSDNQYRKYIENTIRPLQNQLETVLNELISKIDPSVTLEFIDKFQFDLDDKIERSIKLFENGALTINELREIAGEEPFTDENANKSIIRQGFELLEDIGVNEITDLTTNNNASK